jgi:dihydrofolate synthase/folylpolyglutamate synthase
MHTPDLHETLTRLDDLTDWERRPRDAMRVGLNPMLDLMLRLGDPHLSFRSVHVAGTKGKGSVCALVEAGLLRAGYNVGRYSSPHLQHVTERISIDQTPVDETCLAGALTIALDAYEEARRDNTAAATATWFDVMTAAAFIAFREAGVEWAVVEVGLGGRLDSTNVIDAEVAVVTNIELEHTEVLGPTRAEIAREKVGILKSGAVLVTPLSIYDEADAGRRQRALDYFERVREHDPDDRASVCLASIRERRISTARQGTICMSPGACGGSLIEMTLNSPLVGSDPACTVPFGMMIKSPA